MHSEGLLIISFFSRRLFFNVNTQKINLFFSPPKQVNDFDALTTHLLDNSAAKHKISVKPKKNHSSSNLHKNVSPQSQTELNTNQKYVLYL